MKPSRIYRGAIVPIALAALSACTANGVGSAAGSPTAAQPVVTVTVTPDTLQEGQSGLITWSSTGATACSASGAWNGAQALANATGVTTGALATGVHSYGLTCSGPGGSGSDVHTVVVGAAQTPAVGLQLEPASIPPGGTAQLTWSSTNATSCTGEGGSGSWSGPEPTANAQGTTVGPFSAEATYAYTLECAGPGGSATSTRILTVTSSAPPAPPSISLSASPLGIYVGQSTQLSWLTGNAASCIASGGSPGDGWSGSQPVTGSGVTAGPIGTAGDYSFVLSCSGPGGSTVSAVTVTVSSGSPPTGESLSITVDPPTITAGVAAVLSWTTANVTSCTASGSWSGAQALVGSEVSTGVLVVPGNYDFTLTCSGTQGSITDTASLTVNAAPASILSFGAAATSLQVGQSTALSWSTLNAVACTGSGGLATDGWAGTVPVSGNAVAIGPFVAPGDYTYTLTCSGPGGSSGPQSVTISVTAATPAATVLTFSATPSTVSVGGSVSLLWTTANASSCVASGGTGSDGWGGSVATASLGTTVGPFTTSGTYTYSLQCSGSGGTGARSSVSVAVGAAAPPPVIIAFAAIPTSLSTGQSVVLTWSSSNATGCTASGGSGADGWGGAVASSSVGTSVGPLNTAGMFTYALQCDGAGGSSAVSSVTVTVNAPLLPASILAFLALPNSILSGQSITLSWATLGATGCTASGGSAGDGWGGSVPASSLGMSVGPVTTTGTITYSLGCAGPGGPSATDSTSVAVTPVPVGPPTVTLTANGQNPAVLQPGQSLTLAWSTSHANSCTASGGTGSDGWGGNEGTSSTGQPLGTISTPGVYTYTLTCSGPGGSDTSSVTVTVISSSSADCGIGTPSTALLDPDAAVTSDVAGICLINCGVTNAANVIDADQTDYATMSVGLGVLAIDQLTVTDTSATYPAGRTAGFKIGVPGQVLSLSVLGNITVDTLLNGAVQESGTVGSVLRLNAFGNLSNPNTGFLGFTTHKPFNAVRIDVGSLASVIEKVNVYAACTTLQ